MFAIIQAAGWPIWFLLAASIIALTVIVERVLYLRPARILPPTLLPEVIAVARNGRVDADTLAQLEQNSPLGQVLAAGLRNVKVHGLRHGAGAVLRRLPVAWLLLLGVWPCLGWAQAQGIVLRSSPRLQEQLSPAESREGAMQIDAERIRMRPDMDAELEGDVLLRRPGMAVRADRLEYDQTRERVKAEGRVRINRQGNVLDARTDGDYDNVGRGFRLHVRTAREIDATPDPPDTQILLGPFITRGERTIICGAQNHQPGDKVPLILPNFALPLKAGDKDYAAARSYLARLKPASGERAEAPALVIAAQIGMPESIKYMTLHESQRGRMRAEELLDRRRLRSRLADLCHCIQQPEKIFGIRHGEAVVADADEIGVAAAR